MKRLLSALFVFLILVSLCGCHGNFGNIDLKKPIEIPADGLIEEKTIRAIKKESAVATFCGESNGYKYEWIIFGSDIDEPKEVNLLVYIQKKSDGELSVSGKQEGEIGFPVLLSVYTGEKWEALGATAYSQDKAVSSVSITGNKESILNLSVTGGITDWVIRPDGEISDTTEDDRTYSDGKQTEQDKYLTDPIPEGKPMPEEPENQAIDKTTKHTCIFSIECSTILNNLSELDPSKLELVPSNGIVLATATVTFYEGESVFDVLQRVCKENSIHMEASWTPIYNSAYVEGIHNLYEFDCGSLSGWMYRVNGWYPNYGCSRYRLAEGDVVEWRYTCNDLGKDIGCDWMGS